MVHKWVVVHEGYDLTRNRGLVPDAQRAPLFEMCKGDPQGPRKAEQGSAGEPQGRPQFVPSIPGKFM